MNIYLHELKMKTKSIITWSISLVFMITLYLSAFSVIGADTAIMTATMANFPPELLMAFGMENMDFGSIMGFYGVVFLFCQILLAIQASNYGFSLVSIEERELTADFLLAKPITRNTILNNKLLAALTALTVSNVVVWITSFAVIAILDTGEYESKGLILLLLSIVVFQLFFLSVGMVISLLMKRVRSVTPLSMALAFGMYLLNAFAGMLGEETFELISPFKHFEPNFIISNTAYDTPLVFFPIVVIVISIAASYWLYNRRNIASAI